MPLRLAPARLRPRARHLDAIHVGHLDIHEDEIGAGLVHDVQRLGATGGEREPVIFRQQEPGSAPGRTPGARVALVESRIEPS